MAIKNFESLIAWQKAQNLAVDIYLWIRDSRDAGFKDQITRAVISISNNIAEGFDRNSRSDFSRFLYYSISSCSEVKSMLYLAHKLNYIGTESKDQLIAKCNEVSMIIRGLIKSLQKSPE